MAGEILGLRAYVIDRGPENFMHQLTSGFLLSRAIAAASSPYAQVDKYFVTYGSIRCTGWGWRPVPHRHHPDRLLPDLHAKDSAQKAADGRSQREKGTAKKERDMLQVLFGGERKIITTSL